MTNYKCTQKHMNLDDRIFIEKSLDKGIPFKEIAVNLRKDPTTISKEVKKHFSVITRNSFGSKNACQLKQHCERRKVCGKLACHKRCASCGSLCNSYCPDFVLSTCYKLLSPPFVCNACDKKTHCRFEKRYYRASVAHSSYRTLLSTSREGINLSPQDLEQLDALVTPLIHQGQSIRSEERRGGQHCRNRWGRVD